MTLAKQIITTGLLLTNIVNAEMVTGDRLKYLEDYLKRVPEVGEFKKLIKRLSSAIVLIYTVSTNAVDDHYIYNSALKPRKDTKDYRYGVTSGVVVSSDGIVVTTYKAAVNANKFIISIDSEINNNNILDKVIISDNDYEAEVVKKIPELNLLFLRIKSNKNNFKYLELGNDSTLRRKSSGTSTYLINGSAIVGKAKGRYFVRESKPMNDRNEFDIHSSIISRLCLRTIKGISTLVIYNPSTTEGVMPENSGGAIISLDGKLLGIADYQDHLDLPATFAIPVSTISKGFSIAFPPPAGGITINNLNQEIEVAPLTDKEKQKLKSYISKSRDTERNLVQKMSNINVGVTVSLSFDSVLPDNKESRKITIFDMIDNGEFGVSVKNIEEKSYAYQLGMRPGDILIEFNDDVILDPETFTNLINQSLQAQTLFISALKGDKKAEYELRR